MYRSIKETWLRKQAKMKHIKIVWIETRQVTRKPSLQEPEFQKNITKERLERL